MEYILRHGSMTAAADTHGGELVSFKDGSGKEYIWQGDPAYWSGRNPNLFPIVGGLKDGTVYVDGRPYHMGRHGFTRNSEFSVIEQGEDFIVFQLEESESTLQVYPFRFDLRVRHQLTENGFFTQFEVRNPGDVALPFCVGAHTAFNCPMNEGEAFVDYRIVFDHAEDAWALIPNSAGCLSRENKIYALPNTDTLPLKHETYARVDTLIFEGLKSTGINLLGPDGHGVRMEFPGFPMIAFWTVGAKKAPYICLEPWHGCAAYLDESGEFSDKHRCIILAPGECKVLRYTVSII